MSPPANAQETFRCHVNSPHPISDLHASKKEKKWARVGVRISHVTHWFSSLSRRFPDWWYGRGCCQWCNIHQYFPGMHFSRDKAGPRLINAIAALMLSAYFAPALTCKVQAAEGSYTRAWIFCLNFAGWEQASCIFYSHCTKNLRVQVQVVSCSFKTLRRPMCWMYMNIEERSAFQNELRRPVSNIFFSHY